MNKGQIFIDFSFANYGHRYIKADIIAPCLVTKHSLYSVPMGRLANPRERLSLQGFSPDFKQVVSDTKLAFQLGNSMSVNVLKALITNLINVNNPS